MVNSPYLSLAVVVTFCYCSYQTIQAQFCSPEQYFSLCGEGSSPLVPQQSSQLHSSPIQGITPASEAFLYSSLLSPSPGVPSTLQLHLLYLAQLELLVSVSVYPAEGRYQCLTLTPWQLAPLLTQNRCSVNVGRMNRNLFLFMEILNIQHLIQCHWQ